MTSTYFTQWRAAGYRELLSVMPPDARTLKQYEKDRGKIPGVRLDDGLWAPMKNWGMTIADDAMLGTWQRWGGNMGLRLGSCFLLDLDIYEPAQAQEIEDAAIAAFGPAPLRVGEWPKRALLYRTDGAIVSQRLHFNGKDGVTYHIEVNTHTVVEGIHPKTREPYAWPRGRMKFADLSAVTPDQLKAFMDAMEAKLPGALREKGATSEGRPPAALKGNSKVIEDIMRRMRNTREAFPTYGAMITVGYGLRAAIPHRPELAHELWHLFASDWEGGDYDYALSERRFESFKDARRVGADKLYELGDKYAPRPDGVEHRAAAFLIEGGPEPDEPDPNAEPIDYAALSPVASAEPTPSDVYPLLSVDDIVSRPPPVFLVDRHIPEVSLGFIYSTPGAGKSFLALDIGLSIATGLAEWHGDPITAPADRAVLYIAAEGSFGFRNRIRAWMKAHGQSVSPKRFLMIEKTINFMKREDVDKLLRTVRSVPDLRACLIVVDTVSRALPGSDENLQKEMSLFVEACDRLKESFRCAVLGIHHANRQGEMRGSTVLLGAGDFVFKLDRKKGATIGTLTCEKQKDAPDGWEQPYRFDTVAIEDGDSSLVPQRADLTVGPSVVLTPAVSSAVLTAMRAAWDAGEPWAKSPLSKDRYAVKRMVADFGFTAVAAEEALNSFEQTGRIRDRVASSKSKRRGYEVVGDIESLADDEPVSTVFD